MNIVPFDSKSLPAHISADKAEGNEFGFSKSGPAVDVLSTKGKTFTLVSGGERKILTKPGADDEPAVAVEVVILDSAPKGGLYQKTFYAQGYVEGSNAKPDCHSVDGVSPAADVQDKQASKCALCPQNAKGSGATQQNPSAKACRSSKVLAIAAAGNLNRPMLLRVPGTSTIALKEFGEKISARGVKSYQVITKIGFDISKPYPALTFRPIGFTTPEMHEVVMKQRESDLVKVIVGEKALNALKADSEDDEFAADPEYVPPPKVEVEKPAPKKEVKKVAPPPVAEDDSDLDEFAPVQNTKVEEEKPAPKKEVTKKAVVAEGGIEDALDSLNFDD